VIVVGAGVPFGCTGTRRQRRSWLIAAAVYLILDLAGSCSP
jgi:hypothetical protein